MDPSMISEPSWSSCLWEIVPRHIQGWILLIYYLLLNQA